MISLLSYLIVPFPSLKKRSKASNTVDLPISFLSTKTVKLLKSISVIFLKVLKFVIITFFYFHIVLSPIQIKNRIFLLNFNYGIIN